MVPQSNTIVVQAPGTSGLAIAGLIFSVLGWFTCGLLCIPGAFLSFLGLFSPGPKGVAIAGLIVGFPGVLFFALFGFGIIAAAIGIGNAANQRAERNAAPVIEEETAPAPEVVEENTRSAAATVAFDIPSLIGKTNGQVRETLGQWSERVEDPKDKDWQRFKLQEQLGLDLNLIYEWDDAYSKDGQELLVTFDLRDDKVKDFFLPTDDLLASKSVDEATGVLMQRGNLGPSEEYRVEPVKAINDQGITGIKIIPTNFPVIRAGAKEGEREQQHRGVYTDWIRQRDEERAQERQDEQEAAKKATADAKAKEDAKFRTWSSASGKYNVQAKLVGFLNEVVLLENRDGKRIKVPLEKLSTADIEYVQKRRKERR